MTIKLVIDNSDKPRKKLSPREALSRRQARMRGLKFGPYVQEQMRRGAAEVAKELDK